MAEGLQIGQLPQKENLTGNELIPFQQGSSNGSMSTATLKKYIGTGGGTGGSTDYMNYITEYNVSIQHPTSGIDGSNKYSLEGAIAQVPPELRNIGLKVSFINSAGKVETWEFQGGTFTDVNDWVQGGIQTITEELEKVHEKLKTTNDKGFYLIDNKGNIVIKYDNEGFDVALLSNSFKNRIKSIDGIGSKINVNSLPIFSSANKLGVEANKFYRDSLRRMWMDSDSVIPLILVAGQSNAVGHESIDKAPQRFVDNKYYVDGYFMWNEAEKNFKPYNMNHNNGGDINTFGFDPFFAEKYYQKYQSDIYMFKIAVGGTSIQGDIWNPNIPEAGDGSLCLKLIDTFTDIMDWGKSNGKVILPLCALWLQGETDAVRGYGDLYQQNVSNVFSFFRGVFGGNNFPIIPSMIAYNESGAMSKKEERKKINDALVSLSQTDENIKVVDVTNLQVDVDYAYTSFDYHFLSKGYEYIGQQMFVEFNKLYL